MYNYYITRIFLNEASEDSDRMNRCHFNVLRFHHSNIWLWVILLGLKSWALIIFAIFLNCFESIHNGNVTDRYSWENIAEKISRVSFGARKPQLWRQFLRKGFFYISSSSSSSSSVESSESAVSVVLSSVWATWITNKLSFSLGISWSSSSSCRSFCGIEIHLEPAEGSCHLCFKKSFSNIT